jgi:hypothetical protein
MIHPALYKNPVALDSVQHRLLRLRRNYADPSHLAALNSFFVTNDEFVDACREHAVVWIPAGTDADGKRLVAPVAVFGLKQEENLYLEPSGWRPCYLPALVRTHPFALARAGEDRMVLCYDAGFAGFSLTEGERLFTDDGAPTEFTQTVHRQLQALEIEIERTRHLGARLMELELLQDMRFEATLPDGQTLTVDGFLSINDKRLGELEDAVVLEFHRNGVLGLIHAHRLSMGHLRRLADWHAQRVGARAKG